ncbi:MAG: hypothetical protein JW701_00540 [Kosmotogaceae bacterium]|nr:hypothetical protein [Kosmotogaceae bacterium]
MRKLVSKPYPKEVAWGATDFGPSETGFVVESELFHISPRSASFWDLNFTSFPGKCSAVLYSLLFWLSKWGYKNVKVEDTMDISPLHPQYYQLTIGQKKQLEGQIKEGLTGISSSISDFELLFHDLRKYKDFLQYYEMMENAEEELKKTKNEKDKNKWEDERLRADQSLRSIFIDSVDVHTGDAIALTKIAQRWPTIIADFMKLKDEDNTADKIKSRLRVSEAERVVLATKNKLYLDWRNTFGKVVKERYHRILSQVKSRKYSIDEYKRILRPYIQRYRTINEVGPAGPRAGNWLRPGAQAASIDTVTLWSFKDMTPAEHGKPTFEAEGGPVNILKRPWSPILRDLFKKNYDYLNKNDYNSQPLTKLELSPNGAEPLDKWVLGLLYILEDHYSEQYNVSVRFSLADLMKARFDFLKGWGDKPVPYFKLFETDVTRVLIRLPDGVELEDITYSPMHFYMESYNMMFLRFLEVKAQEKAMDMYVDEMLGDTTKGKSYKELAGEYDDLFKIPGIKEEKKEEKSEKEKEEEIKAADNFRAWRDSPLVQKQLEKELKSMKNKNKLFKTGQYESMFDDRVTGPWFTDIGGSFAMGISNFLKAKFDVPGIGTAGIK